MARSPTSKPLSRLRSIPRACGGTQLATPRWTTVEDFLSDLPKYHCTVKPRHSFCTVCLRINHDVAFDCPLREMPEDPAARGTYVPRHGGPAMASTGYGSAGSDDVPAAVMAEGPLIEFAPSNEPPVKRRMKAKPLDSRATGVQATAPAGRPRPPREPAPAIEQAATDDSIAAIPDAGSESTVATSPPPAALEQPAAPSDALEAADETEAPQKGPKRGRWRNR